MKSCCFFGHWNAGDVSWPLFDLLIKKIEALILDGYGVFYFGSFEIFDLLSYHAVDALQNKYKHIKTICVETPANRNGRYADDIKSCCDETYCPKTEEKPNRLKISHQHQAIINESDYCIFYVKINCGQAYQALRYAMRKKKALINIAEFY